MDGTRLHCTSMGRWAQKGLGRLERNLAPAAGEEIRKEASLDRTRSMSVQVGGDLDTHPRSKARSRDAVDEAIVLPDQTINRGSHRERERERSSFTHSESRCRIRRSSPDTELSSPVGRLGVGVAEDLVPARRGVSGGHLVRCPGNGDGVARPLSVEITSETIDGPACMSTHRFRKSYGKRYGSLGETHRRRRSLGTGSEIRRWWGSEHPCCRYGASSCRA